ncbi:GNAT family N-acetyltransferase [Aspergillus ibericus CBS 121593]|uniref:N-acetyltransferase domain-containing protein n=1 Tax=Aspergillus ibericus CBS 121593 TaxID=1448316 RepID=A0A395H607_9EURO|nr:hypothetical protein BO80DRAFT_443669 [Aspergillus ibericus CBS 121593]RAL02358.1 hypothetical protein BO80DRAFT_443669 [Aspergillus ibericus CBS 121593]
MITTSAQKYKQLRLHALSVAPASFSSTYEIESALPEEGWVTRLTAGGKETFICAATSINNHATEKILFLPEESGQKTPSEDQELWQMLSLFTLPDHRGQGLGKKLCREALDYLVSHREAEREVCVRLMVKPENHATVRLYQGLGFVEAGKCTLAEAFIATGDRELPPKDISGEKYSSRTGLIMMLEIRRW